MSNKTIGLADRVYDYLLSVSVREAPLLKRLRDETSKLPLAMMQIAPEQGQLLSLLVQALQPKKCIEVGVFTGYSSLVVALALPPDGHITACDVNEQWTSIARRYWHEAGVEQKIDLYLAPALQTLDRLVAHGQASTYDFAFIDADTQLLPDDLTLPLLWGGLVANLFGLFVPLASAVIGAAAGYLALWTIYWLFKLIRGKEGMGYGDFKLLAALGAWLGWPMLPQIVLVSSVLGAIGGIAAMALKGRDRAAPLPFGPWLAGAGAVAMFFGQQINSLYFR